MDENQLRMAQAAFSPQRILAIGLVQAIAGYDLPQTARTAFLRFHALITSTPPPEYITRWRSTPRLEKWYLAHAGGVLDNVQDALTGAYYHRDNVAEIESALLVRLERLGLKETVPPNSTVAFGNTVKLDLEYQAFVLVARRCLDYLTRALAAYFKHDFHSFRDMPKSLERLKPSSVADALTEAHARHVDSLAFVLSDGQRKSVRDTISHYEHVQAGTLNVSGREGLFFAGGGERLSQPNTGSGLAVSIAAAMDKRLDVLQQTVDDILISFVEAVARER